MDGMGPVRIGMALEEVRSLVGPIEDDNTGDTGLLLRRSIETNRTAYPS